MNGVGRKLRGKQLALLIADRLSVDEEAGLGVIAQRVKEPIAIGGDPAGTVNDRLAEASPRIDGRYLEQLRSIDIHMRGGVVFERVHSPAFHHNGRGRSGDGERGHDLNRNRVADVHGLRKGAETGSGHLEMIGIGGNVTQPERPIRPGFDGLAIARDRIVERNLRSGYGAARRVGNASLDGACVTQRLSHGGIGGVHQYEAKKSEEDYSHVSSRVVYVFRTWQDIPVNGGVAAAGGLNFAVNGPASCDLPAQQFANTSRLAFTDDELLPVAEGNEPALAAHRAHLTDMVDVDKSVAVDAAKACVVQLPLNRFQRLRRQIALFRRDNPDQIPFGLECKNLARIQEQILVAAPRHNLPHGPGGGRLSDFLDFRQLLGHFGGPGTKPDHPLDSLRKPVLADWFEQIIDGPGFEGLNCVVIEGRHDDDHRHMAHRLEFTDDVEPAESRHLQIEEDDIG